MKSQRAPSLKPDDDAADSLEVPAAVVCARCGRPECLGCDTIDETTIPSGIVAIVPWERPGLSAWSRLWATARIVTRSAPQFCSAVPSGDLPAALLFATLCEFGAIGSMGLTLALAGLAIAPHFALAFLAQEVWRTLLLRVLLVSLPGFSFIMVAAHVALGLGINHAGGKLGGKFRRNHALRFGLYSAGWDLMTSPLGFVVVLFTEGPRAAIALIPMAFDVAGRGSAAFARGVLQLDESRALKARTVGAALSLAFTCCAVAVLLAVIGILIAI